MENTIYLNKEFNSEFSYQPHTHESTPQAKPLKVDDYELPYAYNISKEDLPAKVHLTNKQTIGISLLVHSVFFGILALIFPPASVPYAIYIALSVACAVGGGAVLACREQPVEVPLGSDYSDIY